MAIYLRFDVRALCVVVLGVFFWVSAGPALAQKKQARRSYSEQELSTMSPKSANPYVSFLPQGVEPDWDYWHSYMKVKAGKRAASRTSSATRAVALGESEPNNTPGTADPVAGFGSGADPVANITGSISAPPAPGALGSPTEDDGSITLATLVGVSTGAAKLTSSTIGDGPHGSGGTGNGDFDFYEFSGVLAGQTILVDIDTSMGSALDSFVTIWDSAGNLLALNDDDPFVFTLDSFIEFTVPANDTYYASVGAFSSPFPLDPFDSSSGLGVGEEGTYSVLFGLDYGDRDFFSVSLQAGDIVGATLTGTGVGVGLVDPSGVLRVASSQDFSGTYPLASPLPGGGNSVFAYVAKETGTHAIGASGRTVGAYSMEVNVFRPIFEGDSAPLRQVLFLDFDGETIPASVFGTEVTLSPLSSFLSGWGLGPGDESAVIDSIVAAVEENVDSDIVFPGGDNPGYAVDIRNSRDHADPFGLPNVSRVVIGGTIEELGIGTIGIAESIDIGNFETEETGVVLLDLLSAPAPDPNSLNSFSLTGGKTIFDLIGAGVGNITAHEAGHFLGNFHTDQFNLSPNIMDQGGFMGNSIGDGFDGVFGSGDDTDVDFGVDSFVPNEGFAGNEDTLNSIAFGLTAGNGSTVFVDLDAVTLGLGTLASPFNSLTVGVEAAASGATIHMLPSTGAETFSGVGALSKPMMIINENPGGGAVKVGEE